MDYQTLFYWGVSPANLPAPLGSGSDYCGPHQEEALARLHYAVESGMRCVRVQGASGVGKTRLLNRFSRALEATGPRTAVVAVANRETQELLFDLNVALGWTPENDHNLTTLWRHLVDRITGLQYAGSTVVLIFDQFEAATTETIRLFTRLARLDVDRTTLIVAQTESSTSSFSPAALSGIKDLVDLNARLPALSLDEVESFLAACWPRERPTPLIRENALERFHELTQGNPRRIQRLMSVCLVAGRTLGVGEIDSDLLDRVAEEMGGGSMVGETTARPQARAA